MSCLRQGLLAVSVKSTQTGERLRTVSFPLVLSVILALFMYKNVIRGRYWSFGPTDRTPKESCFSQNFKKNPVLGQPPPDWSKILTFPADLRVSLLAKA